MRTMAPTKFLLLAVLSFVVLSLQDDPIVDFCRRWAHQTAVVDGRLYVDGGRVAYNTLAYNYTNEWLLFSDLHSRSDVGFPIQHANLSKPANIPNLSGGYLWADEVNKCFYQFGGEFAEGDSPKDFSMWTYDVILNQWNSTKPVSSEKVWQRPSYGAGTQAESRGLGFYYGGWVSNKTTPGWKGPPLALSSIVQFNFTTGNLKNSTHPDGIGRAEGQMVFLPVSDGGVLVYFGGIEDPYHNGSYNAANMTKIHIYDVNSGKWYSQTATGDVPMARRQFCAGVTWPDDQSSFNIYLYGGYGFDTPAAFDDVYILSLPSFKWIKGYPLGGSDTNQFGHGGCSANVVSPDQMMVMGGWFPNTTFGDCDQPDAQGQHNMVLGSNTGKEENGLWDKYDPKLSSYAVPTLVVSAIGGGTTGSATVTAPATWDHNDLRVYYKLKPSFASRTPTRALLATSSSSSTASPAKTNIGAIAGGTIGGLAVLIAILGLILFCFHRRKKAKKTIPHERPAVPPAELDITSIPQEMATTNTSKYVAAHERSFSNDHSPYSGVAPVQSRTTSYDHSSPHTPNPPQQYQTTSSHPTVQYSSPQDSVYKQTSHSPLGSPHHHAELFFPNDHVAHNTQHEPWSQHASPPLPQGPIRQRQYSYTSPTSPQTPSSAHPQQQVYYPPPPDPEQYTQHSHPSPPGHRGSPTGTQYSGETQHGNTPNISAVTTPAQFYAQPVPARNPAPNENARTTAGDARPPQSNYAATSNHMEYMMEMEEAQRRRQQ